MTTKNVVLSALVIATGLALAPVQQAHADSKGISTANCQPYGPGTTADELTFVANAIYNPGTTAEKFLCPIDKQYFGTWDDTNPAHIDYYFKTGGISGRVTCTTYVGSPAGYDGAVASATAAPPTVGPGTYSTGSVELRDSTVSNPLTIENVNVLCTITPKVLFGGFYFVEPGAEIPASSI